jgi:hypothetical protein
MGGKVRDHSITTKPFQKNPSLAEAMGFFVPHRERPAVNRQRQKT